MICGPNIQRRRDIYNEIIRRPWISEAELRKMFNWSSRTQKAIHIGLHQKIFVKHIHSSHQVTYTVNPELTFDRILHYIKTYAIDKTKMEALRQQYIISSQAILQAQHNNRQKALLSSRKHTFLGGVNTNTKSSVHKNQVQYTQDMKKLQDDLKNARRYRQDMSLNGVDRGALK